MPAHAVGPRTLKLTSDCGAKTQIKMGELIRCRECGHRVMYKPRTHKSESSAPLESPKAAQRRDMVWSL